MKMEDKLGNQKNKEYQITIHKGPKLKYADIKYKLFEFIEFKRKLNNSITAWGIANEIFKYYPNLLNENFIKLQSGLIDF